MIISICLKKSLDEAKKYVLKIPNPNPTPQISNNQPSPEDDYSDLENGLLNNNGEQGNESPMDDDMNSEPPMDNNMGGEQGNEPPIDNNMGGEQGNEQPMDNENSGENGGDEINDIQKTTGTLAQQIRDNNVKIQAKDLKYIINSILSASPTEKII